MQFPNVRLRRLPVPISKSACVIAEKITNLDQQVCTCVLEAMCLLRVYIGAVRTISLSGPCCIRLPFALVFAAYSKQVSRHLVFPLSFA